MPDFSGWKCPAPCSQGHSGESCHIYAPRLAFVTILGGQLQFGVRWASPGHGRSAHGLELTVRDLYEASAQCWKNAETVLHSALSKIWQFFQHGIGVSEMILPSFPRAASTEDYCDDITAILVDLSWVHVIWWDLWVVFAWILRLEEEATARLKLHVFTCYQWN